MTLKKGYSLMLALILVICTLSVSTNSKAKQTNPDSLISYKSYLQDTKWQSWRFDGQKSGTIGKSKRIEGFRIKLFNGPNSGHVTYRAYVQKKGWSNWKSDGAFCGRTGKSLRLEAIQIKLTGKIAKKYDIYYRVHSERYGWLGWTKNGFTAGTSGLNLRIEAFQVKLVKKNGAAPGSTYHPFYSDSGMVKYRSNVEGKGWTDYVEDGDVSGTVGMSKKIRAIRINLIDKRYPGSINYTTHVEDAGWQSWVKDGKLSGTSKNKRVEAIRIKLSGQMAQNYDVYYRVQCESKGWLSWVKNGKASGTTGKKLRVEAFQVVLIEKGAEVILPSTNTRILDPNKPMVALTFDDGPGPATGQILDALESVGGRATFFVLGSQATTYSATVKREFDLGCQIGNHTYSHTSLSKLDPASMTAEINQTNQIISNITGGYVPTIVRPPYGSLNDTVKQTLNYPLITWSVDTLDWKNKDSSYVYNYVMSHVGDGEIILMHDIHPTTAAACASIIPALAQRGYQLVTVEELAAAKGRTMTGGQVYNSFK